MTTTNLKRVGPKPGMNPSCHRPWEGDSPIKKDPCKKSLMSPITGATNKFNFVANYH